MSKALHLPGGGSRHRAVVLPVPAPSADGRHEASYSKRRDESLASRLCGCRRFTSTAVGDLVSWSVDANGHVFPANGGAADEEYPHIVVDRGGVEWAVREVDTPQPWARATRCLVLNSRECVRRIWRYPAHWRKLDADALLQLGIAD